MLDAVIANMNTFNFDMADAYTDSLTSEFNQSHSRSDKFSTSFEV